MPTNPTWHTTGNRLTSWTIARGQNENFARRSFLPRRPDYLMGMTGTIWFAISTGIVTVLAGHRPRFLNEV